MTDMIKHYGIREQVISETAEDYAVESLTNLGYAVVDGGYSPSEISDFSDTFDLAHEKYLAHFGLERLEKIDEDHTIRVLFLQDERFLSLATNTIVRNIITKMIGGLHILTQQNGIINPPNGKKYNQGAYHRDLPYQHVVFSRPLAINALYCIDDFTVENGATVVLPASHKQEKFPSAPFISENQIQLTAPAGSFLLLDCMCYHSGSSNMTSIARRAVNHVYGIPLLRQQIDLPSLLGEEFTQNEELRNLLGYDAQVPDSVEDYLRSRELKNS